MDEVRTITRIDRDTPAQSPFLPGTSIQYAWDSTSLGYLKTCPRLYQYVMIDGWGYGDESVHLRFGGEYHTSLEHYDKARAEGVDHEDAIREVVRELLIRTWGWEVNEETKAGKYKNRKTLLRTVLGYLDHFIHDPASTFILNDGTPAVELSFRFELDWGPGTPAKPPMMIETDKDYEVDLRPGAINYVSDDKMVDYIPAVEQPYLLSGHLDRVVDYLDGLYVMDRKTTTTTPGDYFFDQFSPSNQMTLYSLASNVILGSPIKGVIIDAAQILVDSNRYVRGFTYRTPDQLDEWTNDLRYWFSAAESFATAGYWPMNDTACDKFGGCRFRKICSKSPQVREQFLKSDFVQLPLEDRWNPLKPR